MISDPQEYTKTLGLEWNTNMDHFHVMIANLPPLKTVTKRLLVSDITKTFDVLGWFVPSIIKAKILLQWLREQKVDWDDPVYPWLQWRFELNLLANKNIPHCYFPKASQITSFQFMVSVMTLSLPMQE